MIHPWDKDMNRCKYSRWAHAYAYELWKEKEIEDLWSGNITGIYKNNSFYTHGFTPLSLYHKSDYKNIIKTPVIICDIGDKKVVNNGTVPLPTHPYHIVDQSPWPIALSGVLLSLTISAVLSFHGYPMGSFLLLTSFILLNWGMGLWFKDIITEASFLGAHTDKVQKGISLGVVLFIISEVFFFLSIFWAYFHSSLAPAIEIGSEWPPKGIEPVNASEVPTANTTILLSSGSAVTVTHHVRQCAYLFHGKITFYTLYYCVSNNRVRWRRKPNAELSISE